MAFLDHMLLTLPSPIKHSFEQRPIPSDFAAPKRHSAGAVPQQQTRSHRPAAGGGGSTRYSAGRASPTARMSTPHRSLPPPAPMSFSEPTRLQPPTATQQQQSPGGPLAGMPAPPPQWPGMEDAMRHWLGTRAEEEKRRQEEEKTRQETLRLEQRKIEHSMLLEVMRSQIPVHLIPAIFLALNNAAMTSNHAEMLQQSIAQIVGSQPSMLPPEGGRERQGSFAQGHSLPPTPQEGPYSALSARGTMSGPPSAQRAHFSSLPGRMKPLETGAGMPQQISPQQPEQAPILFHHWQPPSSGEASGAPSGPANIAEPVHSPRKRKATGPHPPTAMPSSALRYSEVSDASRPHARHRSDASSRSILHPPDDKLQIQTRTRADTAINDETLTLEQQWSSRRSASSPRPPQQSRLQYQSGSYGEPSGFGSQEEQSGRSSREVTRPYSRRTPESESQPLSAREDVKMRD